MHSQSHGALQLPGIRLGASSTPARPPALLVDSLGSRDTQRCATHAVLCLSSAEKVCSQFSHKAYSCSIVLLLTLNTV